MGRIDIYITRDAKPNFREWMKNKLGADYTVLNAVTAAAREKYANPVKRSDYDKAKSEYISLHGQPY